jgi:protein-arginine deiminase
MRQFFQRQGVQPVLELHTNWLAVGHIDELVSFVPDKNGKGLLVASSPKRAYELLSQLDPSQPLDNRYALAFNVATVGDLFTKATLQQTMEDFNRQVDQRIFGLDHSNPDPDSIVGMLLNKLKLPPSSVVEVPTVFMNEHSGTWAAVALTPGVVNLSSMGAHSLLPDPFLNAFKSDTQSVLQAVGQTPLWIDNWGLYHVNMGEVHCGSNELRGAFSKKWWEP